MFCETRPNRAQEQRTEEQTVTETCADDFATIRARMEELRREREAAQAAESDLQRELPIHRARGVRWPPSELDARLERVRQPGSDRG
jgi:hypothetical protein